MERLDKVQLTRRDMLKLSGAGAGVFALSASGFAVPKGLAGGGGGGGSIYLEAFPTSPLILGSVDSSGRAAATPFTDDNQLPIPQALRPADIFDPENPKGIIDPESKKEIVFQDDKGAMNPQQDCGAGGGGMDVNSAYYNKYGNVLGQHSVMPDKLGLPNPIVYNIDLQVAQHSFISDKQRVMPINSFGKPAAPPKGSPITLDKYNQAALPKSTIYGFNGTFPGPRINSLYGKPALVHFCNHLGDNDPSNGGPGLDTQDFGAPNQAFLTHLHNGHTAPESDGQPHYSAWRFKYDPARETHRCAWEHEEWVNQLYLNYAAGNDDREKQSFFWFHDHVHGHTGANVYKGMVGLMPIYDPKIDSGDETDPNGLRLPGRRVLNYIGAKDRDKADTRPDGTFNVDYDIPLAFYDCRLDDGVTPHKDAHNGNGETHPEWQGMTYFRHFPNHGFVGDIFTVNGAAYPTLHVDRRRYRLRFLDASISRIYEFKLMTSSKGPKPAKELGYTGDELQGQYRLTDGQQCMNWTQIAAEGGLLPNPLVRDSFELWPAKRKEFVVDFTRYMDGTPTTTGDVIYLVNTMKMTTGRMWDSADQRYQVPVLKIVIGGLPAEKDESVDPLTLPQKTAADGRKYSLREPQPLVDNWKSLMASAPTFELQRGSVAFDPLHPESAETEWLINGQQFEADKPLAWPTIGDAVVWRVKNGGGGWVHPMHLHMEEHTVLYRNGKPSPAITRVDVKGDRHMDDTSKEDVIALDPSEETYISRRFRTFTGPYVAHCHNLAHEDHNMMFGWEILPKRA